MEAFENIKLSFNCPKKLNELQACNGVWSCDSCNKMVHDFRGMSETEILDVFMRSGQKLCGIYDAERLPVLTQQKPVWQKWLSAAMIALGISAISQITYAQQNGAKIGEAVSKTAEADTTTKRTITLGMVAIARPEFCGGDAALQHYLLKHISNKEHFNGIISATFTVEANGTVDDIVIDKSGGIWMDIDLKNALQNSPKWIPVEVYGKAIASKYAVQVDFAKSK